MSNAGRSAFQMARKLNRPIHPVRLYGLHVLLCAATVVVFIRGGYPTVLTLVIGGGLSAIYLNWVYERKRAYVAEIRREVRRWMKAFYTEKKTGYRLFWFCLFRRIAHGERWYVFHDRQIPNRPENLDHILVGPPGVFDDDTKSREKPFAVRQLLGANVLFYDGEAVSTSKTKWGAGKLQKALDEAFGPSKIPVRACWAVHGNLPKGNWNIDGVDVLPVRKVGRYMASFPKALRSSEVEKVAKFIEKTFPKAKN